jgi:Mn-dependent DtxR family transcriptional regulator
MENGENKEENREDIWEKVIAIHIAPSLYRMLTLLEKKPMCASDLGKAMKIRTTSAATYMNRLRRMGLVKCLTPMRYNYRLYTLSEEGKLVLKKLREYSEG